MKEGKNKETIGCGTVGRRVGEVATDAGGAATFAIAGAAHAAVGAAAATIAGLARARNRTHGDRSVRVADGELRRTHDAVRLQEMARVVGAAYDARGTGRRRPVYATAAWEGCEGFLVAHAGRVATTAFQELTLQLVSEICIC